MQLFNDLDDLYKGGLLHIEDKIICSVCGKEYTQEHYAIKHIENQSCHTMKQIFGNKAPEKLFYKLYKKFSSLENVRHVFTFVKFRRTSMYDMIAKFYVFCLQNNVQNIEDYFDYLIHEYRYKTLATCMVIGKKESTLREFRETSHQYLDDDDNEKFFEANEKRLRHDESFAIRSMERGDITYTYLFTKMDGDEFIEQLPPPLVSRLIKCIEKQNVR
ncbi:MAG: hypothetical protein KJO69_06710 [Gammaproteobacteria bacterium]|nr:hypothetical protein [Gammaproteobacteria bacterium]